MNWNSSINNREVAEQKKTLEFGFKNKFKDIKT